jgi:hypothetical protein
MAERKKIRIRTKAGKLIVRNAIIEQRGERFVSVAQVGIYLYKIVDSDVHGAIWGRYENP